MLPTPQARDGDHRAPADPERRRAAGHQINLDDVIDAVVKLLPTPTCADSRSAAIQTVRHPGRPTPAGCVTLTDWIRLLPTPRASDGTKGAPAQRGSKGDATLPSAIPLPPTSSGNPAASPTTRRQQ